MQARAVLDGAKNYVAFLVRTALFPLVWLWALAVARRHSETDPQARVKVAGAIVIGVVLAGGGLFALLAFQDDATNGMYDQLNNRLSIAVGESAYQDQQGQIDAKDIQIPILTKNLADGQAALEQMRQSGTAPEAIVAQNAVVRELQRNLWLAQLDKSIAQRHQSRLQEEHAFFLQINESTVPGSDDLVKRQISSRVAASSPGAFATEATALVKAESKVDLQTRNVQNVRADLFGAQLDNQAGAATEAEVNDAFQALAEAEDKLATAQTELQAAQAALQGSGIEAPVDPLVFESSKVQGRSDRAFEIKDKAQADLQGWMLWLLLPGLVGVFFAPLSFALGNILKNAWEPSETVGFKEYPGGAMGWFLLLGAFGVPALFFAAWTFWDMDVRSQEGQISL